MKGSDPKAPLHLRLLEPFEHGIAAALHAHSFADAWSERAIAALLAMPGAFGLLAVFGDEPVGLVMVLAGKPDAEILTLAVRSEFRRQGVARQLLKSAGDRVRTRGCERLVLEVAEDNDAALALYRGLDFKEIGRRPRYFQSAGGQPVTAIVLARTV